MRHYREGGMQHCSARLSVLDLQIVDVDGLLVGRVDDVEITVDERGKVQVVALWCGQRALGRRLGGTIGHALQASATRLDIGNAADGEQTGRIDASLVSELTSVVRLSRPLRELPGIAGLEGWLAEHLIGRLPGAGTAATDLDRTPSAGPLGRRAVAAGPAGPLLSELLGAAVTDQSGGPAGLVHDLRLTVTSDGAPVLGPVIGLVVGGPGWRARLAHAWGFAEGRSHGPAVLRALLGQESSRARIVPPSAVVVWTAPLVIAGPLDRHPRLASDLSAGSAR